MKKILLATTMLVGTAGFAAAEVSLSGNARMGIANDGTTTTFNSRVRASVSMSGESDSGLSFGGSFGIHDAGTAAAGTAGSVYISGAFGKLSMGDTSSAAENAVGDLAGVGYTGLDFSNENTFIATGNNETALYSYSAGELTVFASLGQRTAAANSGENYSVGVAYKTETFGAHLGYESVDGLTVGGTGTGIAATNVGDADHIIGALTATVGGVALKAVYGTADVGATGEYEQSGVSASYTMDAMTVSAFYRTTELSGFGVAAIDGETDQFGLGVAYDLGGGATLAAGIINAERDLSALNGAFDDTIYDVGVKFSF